MQQEDLEYFDTKFNRLDEKLDKHFEKDDMRFEKLDTRMDAGEKKTAIHSHVLRVGGLGIGAAFAAFVQSWFSKH